MSRTDVQDCLVSSSYDSTLTCFLAFSLSHVLSDTSRLTQTMQGEGLKVLSVCVGTKLNSPQFSYHVTQCNNAP